MCRAGIVFLSNKEESTRGGQNYMTMCDILHTLHNSQNNNISIIYCYV